MLILRRFLWLAAAIWGVAGAALVFFPRWVMETLFDQFPYPDFAGVRIAGVGAIALAMLMVIVANHLNDAWWWSWAFVVATGGTAGVALLNALFGLPKGESSTMWWLLVGINAFLGLGLIWGLAKTGTERPPCRRRAGTGPALRCVT